MAKFAIFMVCMLVMFYEGLGLHLMWGWYITKVFGGIQPGIVACIGLSMIVSMVKPSPVPDDMDTEKVLFVLLNSVFRVTFMLIVGYILHFWI